METAQTNVATPVFGDVNAEMTLPYGALLKTRGPKDGIVTLHLFYSAAAFLEVAEKLGQPLEAVKVMAGTF